MRMTRVHVDAPLAVGTRLALPDAAATHLVRVLRATMGDPCVLFNGDGHDYDARLVALDKSGVEAEITGARAIGNESPLRIVLVQALARGEKMDWILQKATELGVSGFLPVESERSEVRLEGERVGKRVVHWRSVVIAACEQSGRARVPVVAVPQTLGRALESLQSGRGRFLLDPRADVGIDGLDATSTTDLVLAIGPEGGWSPRDRVAFNVAGFTGLRLGPRVLRTETAGIAAIAALQSRLGDLR